MTKLALISTAHIHTRQFLDNLKNAADGRRAIAIWDDNPERGQRYAQEYGVPFVADLDQVVKNPEVEGFLICAENTRHLKLLEKVIPAGKPTLCEKPLVTSTAELQKVEALLAKSPIPLFCGHFMPWTGEMLKIREMIKNNELGHIFRARFRNAHGGAFGRWFDNPDLAWFAEPELSGGGAMIDLGIHAVHALCLLFGEAEAVWAYVANESAIYPATDDYGLIEIKFRNGVLATVEAAWTQNGGNCCGLEVSGRNFSVWNTEQGYMCNRDGKAAKIAPIAAQPDRVDRLVAAVRGQIPESELAADLLAVKTSVKIIEAAYRSAKNGAWVNI